MQDLLDQFKAILEKVRDLERAFLNIKTLVFPTDEGRLSIPKYDGDPASPADGDIWYDYTALKLLLTLRQTDRTFTSRYLFITMN
jgi:hypothetical protein